MAVGCFVNMKFSTSQYISEKICIFLFHVQLNRKNIPKINKRSHDRFVATGSTEDIFLNSRLSQPYMAASDVCMSLGLVQM